MNEPNSFQDYMIGELKKRFEQLAAIDSWTLSWEDGKTQVELMIALAECISRIEHHQHKKHRHHHHHPHPPVQPEEQEILVIEEIDL